MSFQEETTNPLRLTIVSLACVVSSSSDVHRVGLSLNVGGNETYLMVHMTIDFNDQCNSSSEVRLTFAIPCRIPMNIRTADTTQIPLL